MIELTYWRKCWLRGLLPVRLDLSRKLLHQMRHPHDHRDHQPDHRDRHDHQSDQPNHYDHPDYETVLVTWPSRLCHSQNRTTRAHPTYAKCAKCPFLNINHLTIAHYELYDDESDDDKYTDDDVDDDDGCD